MNRPIVLRNIQLYPEHSDSIVLRVLGFLGLAAAVLLMATRLFFAISFREPLQLFPATLEDEAYISIWKYLHGSPIYTDPHQIPYTASYFNVMFYAFYGQITAWILAAFELEEAWIPTIGHLIGMTATLLGWWALVRILRPLDRNRSLPLCEPSWFATLMFLGPSMGFVAMSVRPDAAAIAFDTLALLWFLSQRSRPVVAVVGFAILAWLSWGFKQSNIASPLALGLFLVVNRRWREGTLLSMIMIALWSGTVILAGSDYRHVALNPANMVGAVGYSVPHMLHMLIRFLVRITPVLFPLFVIAVAGIIAPRLRHLLLRDGPFLLGACGIAAWSVTLLPASAKEGSGPYYHLIGMLYIVLASFRGMHLLQDETPWRQRLVAASFVGWLTFLPVVALSWVGEQGIDRTPGHRKVLAVRDCIARLPAPVFSADRFAALPWNAPRNRDHFVLSNNYDADRKAGIQFEKNGVGGLIESGYFAALILPSGVGTHFDGGELARHYRRAEETCAGYAILVNRNQDHPRDYSTRPVARRASRTGRHGV